MKYSLREVFDAYKLHPEFLGVDIEGVNQESALGGTLLHIAARTGRVDHIQVLAEAGAQIDALGDLGSTPLHEAALCGQAPAVELLLSLGADPRLKNEFGQTAYDVAVLGRKAGVVEIFQNKRFKGRK